MSKTHLSNLISFIIFKLSKWCLIQSFLFNRKYKKSSCGWLAILCNSFWFWLTLAFKSAYLDAQFKGQHRIQDVNHQAKYCVSHLAYMLSLPPLQILSPLQSLFCYCRFLHHSCHHHHHHKVLHWKPSHIWYTYWPSVGLCWRHFIRDNPF